MLDVSRKLIILSAIALLAVGCVKIGTNDSANVPEHIKQNTVVPPQQSFGKSVEVTPVVTSPAKTEARPSPGITIVTYKGVDGKNTLDLLKAGHVITTKTFSGIGEFVESIDGIKPDSKHFWAFYVNGKSSNVGAGSYITKSGDFIEWKLEEIK